MLGRLHESDAEIKRKKKTQEKKSEFTKRKLIFTMLETFTTNEII